MLYGNPVQTYYHADASRTSFTWDRRMPVPTKQRQTQGRDPILWRSASRGTTRRLDESSDDDCSISITPQHLLSESVFVTPDSASITTNEDTTTQDEITDDDILSERTQRKNKAMFHIEHLQHELSQLKTTLHTKNKKPKKTNKRRQRINKHSPTMRRTLTTP